MARVTNTNPRQNPVLSLLAGLTRATAIAALALGVTLAPSLSGCASSADSRSAVAPPSPPSPPLTEDQRRAHLESFDLVWKTVTDRHWDPRYLEAIGWERARDELRPQAQAARTAQQARDAIDELLGRLGQSHFGLIPAEAIEGIAPAAGGSEAGGGGGGTISRGLGESGITVRVIDNQAVITRVAPDSPAARAGITPGCIVVSVRGKPLADTIARLRSAASAPTGKPATDNHPAITLTMALEGALTGKVGDELPLVIQDATDTQTPKTLTLARPEGELADLLGIPIYLSRESRRLPGGAVYLRLSIFAQPATTITWFGQQLKLAAEPPAAPGVIIDLRGNLGGFGAMAMGMGGWLIDKPNQRLGTMFTRDSKLNFILNPRVGSYSGPVAILQDELSASTSEIFAGGLQALGRARIFGTRSAGAALPSIFVKLPSGDTLQYAIANYTSVNGQPLEGAGVTPDEAVPPTRAGLLAGKDEPLLAAERWIISTVKATAAQPTKEAAP